MVIVLFKMVKDMKKEKEEKEPASVRDQLINIRGISPELADQILAKYPTVDKIKEAIADNSFAESIHGVGKLRRHVIRTRLKAPKEEVAEPLKEEAPAEPEAPKEPEEPVPEDPKKEKEVDNMSKKTEPEKKPPAKKSIQCVLCGKKLSKEGVCEGCTAKIKNNKSEVQRAIGIS